MKASEFDYYLPEQLIAQKPLPDRGASRLLVLDPERQQLQDESFANLNQYLNAGDLLVFNDTRVFPARLYGKKESGGKIEILVERILDEDTILALVRASKSPRPGARLLLEDAIQAEVIRREDEFFVIRQISSSNWLELLQQYGHIPLPPYIMREDDESDKERYQTVYADKPGAVAAPTAGLHFDKEMIGMLQKAGVQVAFVTLHVGAGTFQPVRVDDIDEHKMHAEVVTVSELVCDRIQQTRANGGRVIAIGTTVVRSLETAANEGGIKPFQGETRLFITPGYEFKVVDAMLTNFHLPRSTLLMLVSAFAGRSFILEAYQHAVEWRYRFFSYGDAMFITADCKVAQDTRI